MPLRRTTTADGQPRPVPFLKWAGGKSQLLPAFQSLYPERGRFRRYHDPFVGGGAVFFDVWTRFAPKSAFLSDTNAELIGAYTVVRDKLPALIGALEEHRSRHGEDYFYEVRAWNPESLDDVARAARLIYLNKTCFNGLYRVNSKGLFNVPFGRHAAPAILSERILAAASQALQGVKLRVAHFREVLTNARKGDFVYFDPPYDPLSPSANFTSYTQGHFGQDDQKDLADVCRELDDRGCLFMLSNSATKFIQDLYADFREWTRLVPARRLINSKGDKRGFVEEVVVTNYLSRAEGVSRPRAAEPRTPYGLTLTPSTAPAKAPKSRKRGTVASR